VARPTDLYHRNVNVTGDSRRSNEDSGVVAGLNSKGVPSPCVFLVAMELHMFFSPGFILLTPTGLWHRIWSGLNFRFARGDNLCVQRMNNYHFAVSGYKGLLHGAQPHVEPVQCFLNQLVARDVVTGFILDALLLVLLGA
jgi:hypothetical protein